MQSRLNFTPSPLTLGAAPFGMSYGIANTAGQPSESDVHKILDAAADAGITTIDTAALYGSSEQRIGSWLAARRPAVMRVITKVPALPRGSARECQASLMERLSASMRALGIEQLPLVLTHNENDLLDPYILDAFRVAAERKMIGRFGASTYRPEIALRLIETTPIAALQVPASVLDDRFIDAGVFAAAKARDICVFVRSVFLQGALIGNPELLPPHLAPLAVAARQLSRVAADLGRPIAELLIPPIRDIPGASSLTIGVSDPYQLETAVKAIRAESLPEDAQQRVQKVAAGVPPELTDPTSWKSLAGAGRNS
jgi:aryl-alcohol dehydrogenase-like predicted oxidoreductase